MTAVRVDVVFDGQAPHPHAPAGERDWDRELAELQTAWDTAHAPRPPGLLTDTELLDELAGLEHELAAIQARRWVLLAEAETRDTCEAQLGLSTAGWLVHTLTHSARRAKTEVRLACRVAAEPVLIEALEQGTVSVEQAERIGHGLSRLPDDLDTAQRSAVAAHLVGFAAEFGPDGLSRLVNHAVEVVAPDVADAADAAALERAEREQHRDRYASIRQDPDGAWWLTAKLPAVTGAKLARQLNALATGLRTADRVADTELTWGQAMADALAIVFGHHASCGGGPKHGADRPRITLTIDLATLQGALGAAHLVDADTPLTAQQARRLACDADILPLVLGGKSEPLDVGREKRLFTGGLRQAVIHRDRGCAFPGCDRPPADCEIHHIVPWWAGGKTSLTNAATLCEPHHHLVEPNPNSPPETQWQIRLDHRGLPELVTPIDPRHPERGRPVRQHHRFRTRV